MRIAAALCGSALLLSFAAQAQNYSTASLPAPKGGISAVQGASIRRADPALDKLIAPNARIEKLASGFQFTEGPMWHKGELWFSDLRGNKIYSVSPQGKLTLRLDRAGGVDSFDSATIAAPTASCLRPMAACWWRSIPATASSRWMTRCRSPPSSTSSKASR